MKVLILKYLARSFDKKLIEIAYNIFLSSQKQSTTVSKKITFFSKIGEVLLKNCE